MLYSYKTQEPTTLPDRIRLSNGMTKTDSSTFTEEDIADAGYVAVSGRPIVNSSQIVFWSPSDINWVIRDKTTEELQKASESRRMYVNTERNNRIARGFVFENKIFDSRPEDQKRISGATLLAFMAEASGQGGIGNYFWHGGSEHFSWISQDNSMVVMDAPTVISFGRTAAEWERSHIFSARALKDMSIVPENLKDDSYWP